jgi:hypothetical protein
MTDRESAMKHLERIELLDKLYALYAVQCRALSRIGKPSQPLFISADEAETLQHFNNPLPTWVTTC